MEILAVSLALLHHRWKCALVRGLEIAMSLVAPFQYVAIRVSRPLLRHEIQRRISTSGTAVRSIDLLEA